MDKKVMADSNNEPYPLRLGELKIQLQELAYKENVPMSKYIIAILKDYVMKKNLEQADEGLSVSILSIINDINELQQKVLLLKGR